MVDSNKIKLLILWDILSRNTDENHAMNTDEIIAELAKRDIPATRKVIPSDIATLNAYGYEVLTYKKKFHYYYVVNRPFDMAEIVMLADVIKASKLTGTQKKTFVEKLCNTLGGYGTANACKNMISFDTDKRGNSSIIYNADAIERAINANRQISFLYFDYDKHHEKVYRKDGERYTVSPIIMVWNRDNYYMLCFSERHDNIITYRLDKMDSVQVEKAERIPRKEYAEFNSEEYRKQVFSMFGGETKNVTLSFQKDMLSEIFDKFGSDIKIKEYTDECSVTAKIQVSKTFYLWVTGTQGKVRIVSPEDVTTEFNEFIAKIKESY